MKSIFTLVLVVLFSLTAHCEEVIPFHDGEVKLLELKLPPIPETELPSIKAKAFNLSFPVFRAKSGYCVIISSPLGVISGEYEVQILNGDKVIETQKIRITQRESVETEEILEAPETNVLPKNSKLVSRVASEDLEQKNTLISVSKNRLWQKDFIRPVTVKINSGFGLYRVYSKHLRRRTHWGIDFHTPIGTPVKASADGVVIAAKEYYFPGKTVVLDHGLGLYTGYSHLSKMSVRPGQKIKQGEVIGRSGISGKVTGPHLHWFAVNGRVKFDPLTLLNVKVTE